MCHSAMVKTGFTIVLVFRSFLISGSEDPTPPSYVLSWWPYVTVRIRSPSIPAMFSAPQRETKDKLPPILSRQCPSQSKDIQNGLGSVYVWLMTVIIWCYRPLSPNSNILKGGFLDLSWNYQDVGTGLVKFYGFSRVYNGFATGFGGLPYL